MPTAIFRVDASSSIGSGHVRRCLVLAEALEADGWSVVFACRAGTREAVPSLARSRFACRVVPAEHDELPTLRDLAAYECDLLVVDHYGLDARFERACRPWVKAILVIDDLANRPHDCDVLVDQTPGREVTDYASLVSTNCTVLAGSQFALLDPRFRQAREHLRGPNERVGRVLVSFGGTDPSGATARTLEALRVAKLGVAVDVVLGTVNDDMRPIRQLAAELDPPASVHVSVDDMASLIARADMAIGAGGVSALERCCLGVPSMILVVAENQRGNVEGLVRAGAAVSLGAASAVSPQIFGRTLRELAFDSNGRRSMSDAGRRLCDALGPERVMNALNRTIAPDRHPGLT